MKALIALLLAACSIAACQSDGANLPYDGVSSYAGSGFWDTYYGPGSPPKDS